MTPALNKVMVIGYLGRNPEMRFTPSGKSVTNFSVACNRSWKNAKGEKLTETEWFNVLAWGSLAETSKRFLKKGSLVYVEGRLQSRSWQDKEGNPHKSVEIVAQDIISLSSQANDDNNVEDSEVYPF